jgi:hypothetical protein
MKRQGEVLLNQAKSQFQDARHDLATVFIQRCLDSTASEGAAALVTPQNWLFLTSYASLRERLLKQATWQWLVRLGPGAFETITGEVVKAALICLTKREPPNDHRLQGCDASALDTARKKAEHLGQGPLYGLAQADQLSNPDARLVLGELSAFASLRNYASALAGSFAGDSIRFIRCFWEIPTKTRDWEFHQSTVPVCCDFGGRSEVIFWEEELGEMYRLAQSVRHLNHAAQNWLRGKPNWGKQGVVVSQMGDLPATLYTGEIYDCNCCAIVPNDQEHLYPLWAYCSSPEFNLEVRKLNQKMNVTPGALLDVPFDLERWKEIAREKFAGGLPKPCSDDVTQWLFNGHPVNSTAPLQVGVARLLGFCWPRQTGQTVSGAQPVPEDGLHKLADEDGIVCIPSVRGEPPAAERLRALLAAAYGKAWSPGKLDELLSAVDYAGANLEDWLRNGLFDQHSKLFQHRPFIWQIWDGRKDGFSALVNYHKLDHKLLEKLTYTYLGEWIKKQQESVANEESGADDRLVKAQQLQDKLKLILQGEAPYDVFVRWKPLEQQPIGWDPDLNDGVRLNIRPFMETDVLRKRPNIKWGMDRGKNPSGSPWGEERDNDKHLTLAEKREAKKK